MRTTHLFAVCGAVLGLAALSSCRFGNNIVESDPSTGAAPSDEFSRFEMSYPNKPNEFQFCLVKLELNDAGQEELFEYCLPGDVAFTPSYVTKIFTDPLGLSRFLNEEKKLYWALYNPSENPLTKVFPIEFNQNTGEFSYYKERAAAPLWPKVDPNCMYQNVIAPYGFANPEQRSLGLTYREYDVYPGCDTVLNQIKDCLNSVAGACTPEELTMWQNYFGPWIDNGGLAINDIPLLFGTGFKVLFR